MTEPTFKPIPGQSVPTNIDDDTREILSIYVNSRGQVRAEGLVALHKCVNEINDGLRDIGETLSESIRMFTRRLELHDKRLGIENSPDYLKPPAVDISQPEQKI